MAAGTPQGRWPRAQQLPVIEAGLSRLLAPYADRVIVLRDDLDRVDVVLLDPAPHHRHDANQQIADDLFLSVNTIKTYVRSGYAKIDVTSRSQAVAWVLRH